MDDFEVCTFVAVDNAGNGVVPGIVHGSGRNPDERLVTTMEGDGYIPTKRLTSLGMVPFDALGKDPKLVFLYRPALKRAFDKLSNQTPAPAA